jgi:hypothetical protein
MAWKWDGRVGRYGGYRDTVSGQFLSQEEVVERVNESIDKTINNVERLAGALGRGDISVNTWQMSMCYQIKKAYSWQAQLAAGGREQMTPEYWGVVGGRIFGQYRYLDDFARQLAAGQLTEGQIRARSTMYINSARQAYWAIRTRMAKKRGYTEERWITKGDESVCSPCVGAGAMDWQPIGTFAEPGSGTVIIGESFCEGLTRCRCEKEYR